MSQPQAPETLNFTQKIIQILHDNWPLGGDEDTDNIFFAGYMIDPQKRFNASGKMIEIEIYPISGVANLSSLHSSTVNDLYKLDYWIKITDESDEGRQQGENQRFRVKKAILDTIHNAQSGIENLNIAFFSRFANADEIQNKPIVLHESTFITGEYFHYKSS